MTFQSNNDSNSTAISQKVLEQNEDILAAIVENLQIGRLDDCIQHYTILQNNLIQLATELDNYPTEELDAYQFLSVFPDEIMRKDVLENYLTMEERGQLQTPNIPPCDQCLQNKISEEECRNTLKHIEPNTFLSNLEKTELIHAAQVVLARQKQNFNENKSKKDKRSTYRRWNQEEVYTLELGISVFGCNYSRLAEVFQDRPVANRRNELQIKNFLRTRKRSQQGQFHARGLDELLANPPPGYIPPTVISHLFLTHPSSSSSLSKQHQVLLSPTATDAMKYYSAGRETTEGGDILVERQQKNNFLTLVGLASGYHFPTEARKPPVDGKDLKNAEDRDNHSDGQNFASQLSRATSQQNSAENCNNDNNNVDEDINKMKSNLLSIMNNPAITASHLSSQLPVPNDSLLSGNLPSLGTLTNQFIFPQSTLFEESLPLAANKPIPNGNTVPIIVKIGSMNKINESSIRPAGEGIPLHQSMTTFTPPTPAIPGIPTATQIVAATAAAEAAGIVLPSLPSNSQSAHPVPSSIYPQQFGLPVPPPSATSSSLSETRGVNEGETQSSKSEESAALLRLKASSTKDRSEQAKLLLEYYQKYGYQSVPPFARQGLDKLKQKHTSGSSQTQSNPTAIKVSASKNQQNGSLIQETQFNSSSQPQNYQQLTSAPAYSFATAAVPTSILSSLANSQQSSTKQVSSLKLSKEKRISNNNHSSTKGDKPKTMKTVSKNCSTAKSNHQISSCNKNNNSDNNFKGNDPNSFRGKPLTMNFEQFLQSPRATNQDEAPLILKEFNKNEMTILPEFGHDFSFL